MTGSLGTPKEEDKHLYWKNNFFFKALRFLNLLEPGRNVISLSKILVWTCIMVLIGVTIFYPTQIVAVIGAVGAACGSMLNYAYRRHINFKMDTFNMNMPETPAGPSIDER